MSTSINLSPVKKVVQDVGALVMPPAQAAMSALSIALKKFAGDSVPSGTKAEATSIEKFLKNATKADLARVGNGLRDKRLNGSKNTEDLSKALNMRSKDLLLAVQKGCVPSILAATVAALDKSNAAQMLTLGSVLASIREDGKKNTSDMAAECGLKQPDIEKLEKGTVTHISNLENVLAKYLMVEERTTATNLATSVRVQLSTLKEIEAGDHRPTAAFFDRIAEYFDVSPESLL